MLQQPQKPLNEDPIRAFAILLIAIAFVYILWNIGVIVADSMARQDKKAKRIYIGHVLAIGDIDEP